MRNLCCIESYHRDQWFCLIWTGGILLTSFCYCNRFLNDENYLAKSPWNMDLCIFIFFRSSRVLIQSIEFLPASSWQSLENLSFIILFHRLDSVHMTVLFPKSTWWQLQKLIIYMVLASTGRVNLFICETVYVRTWGTWIHDLLIHSTRIKTILPKHAEFIYHTSLDNGMIICTIVVYKYELIFCPCLSVNLSTMNLSATFIIYELVLSRCTIIFT